MQARRRQRIGWLATALAALVTGISAPIGLALAQEGAKDPSRPFPVIGSGGHTNLVHALVFTGPDGQELLSAGLDKVINHWDLANPAAALKLRRTTRPPVWRGPRGAIHALALSPIRPDDPKRPRILAVAGYGITEQMGEIQLYRYTRGAEDSPLDYLGMIGMHSLDARAENQVQAGVSGHNGVVAALAFHPTKDLLASAGADGIVRLWDLSDVANRRMLGHMTHRPDPASPPDEAEHVINGLAFTPDGRHLVAGGVDSFVRVWDAETRALVAEHPLPTQEQQGLRTGSNDDINTLAVSPDGRWVVTGREDGLLFRLDLPNLTEHMELPVTRNERGEAVAAVDAVAFNHDPNNILLAVGFVRNDAGIGQKGRLPALAGRLEIRKFPEGKVVVHRTTDHSNVVRVCAFSPDGRRIAYSGGDDRAVHVLTIGPDGTPVPGRDQVGKGRGQSIWDVRFAPSPDGPDAPPLWAFRRSRSADAPYHAFDVSQNRLVKVAPATLAPATSEARFQVTPSPNFATLLFLTAEGNTHAKILLDPTHHKRWWSSLVLPIKGEKDWPLVAVGMEHGVGIFGIDPEAPPAPLEPGQPALPSYRLIRKFVGHTGSVYAMAVSPDGRWLLTGGADQSVRLYPLADVGQVPRFGAQFEPADGFVARVAGVIPHSLADQAGLLTGDLIHAAGIIHSPSSSTPLTSVSELSKLDGLAAERLFRFTVARPGVAEPVHISSRKLQNPTLSLLPLPRTDGAGDAMAADHVLFLPSGHYLTSIRGDSKYLGWHQNRPNPRPRFDYQTPPTAYLPARAFEATLYKKDVIDRVLASGGDLAVAFAPVPAPAPAAPDPAPAPAPLVAEAEAAPRELVPPPALGPGVLVARDGQPPVVRLPVSRPASYPGEVRYRIRARIERQGGAEVTKELSFPAGEPGRLAQALEIPLPGAGAHPGAGLIRGWVKVEAVSPPSGSLADVELLVPVPPLPAVAADPTPRTEPPPPAPAPIRSLTPTLRILAAVNAGESGGEIPGAVLGASRWDEALRNEHQTRSGLPAPGRFRVDRSAPVILRNEPGAEPATVRLAAQLRGLLDQARKGNDDALPDMLALYVEAQVLETARPESGSRIWLAGGPRDPKTGIAGATQDAEDLIGPIRELSEDYGCRVLLFLDGVHQPEVVRYGVPGRPGDTWRPGVAHLTRRLSFGANVTVVNASEHAGSPRAIPRNSNETLPRGAMGLAWVEALEESAPTLEAGTLDAWRSAHQAMAEPYLRALSSTAEVDPITWNPGPRTRDDFRLFAPAPAPKPSRLANAVRTGSQKAP